VFYRIDGNSLGRHSTNFSVFYAERAPYALTAEEPIVDDQTKPTWLELESVIPLRSSTKERDAERITSLSEDTLKRRFPDLIKQLSDRRRGIKLRDALAIANGNAKPG
jgi:hypothetical protein